MNSITIIVILAVVITVALSYALWIESVASAELFKAGESMCPPRITKQVIPMEDTFRVDITVTNTCSKPFTISYVLVNGRPAENLREPLVLSAGETRTITLVLPRSPGRVFKIILHTANDYNYVLLIKSP